MLLIEIICKSVGLEAILNSNIKIRTQWKLTQWIMNNG